MGIEWRRGRRQEADFLRGLLLESGLRKMFSGGVLRGSVNRIPDLLDALRQEYETVIEDMGVCKAQRDDYERKCFPRSLTPNVPSHLISFLLHACSGRGCHCFITLILLFPECLRLISMGLSFWCRGCLCHSFASSTHATEGSYRVTPNLKFNTESLLLLSPHAPFTSFCSGSAAAGNDGDECKSGRNSKATSGN